MAKLLSLASRSAKHYYNIKRQQSKKLGQKKRL